MAASSNASERSSKRSRNDPNLQASVVQSDGQVPKEMFASVLKLLNTKEPDEDRDFASSLVPMKKELDYENKFLAKQRTLEVMRNAYYSKQRMLHFMRNAMRGDDGSDSSCD